MLTDEFVHKHIELVLLLHEIWIQLSPVIYIIYKNPQKPIETQKCTVMDYVCTLCMYLAPDILHIFIYTLAMTK